ncbi:hypothetical protein BGZ54_000147 [Gamsiella multidivaricata]|nr:hypothetical protein BGZ54_000147 [Gamsiella multidivaricata]
MPDSPLPTMGALSESQPSAQKKQSPPSRLLATKAAAMTSSSRSSPGPATSVEDFGRHKEHRLYEPNEYSKSVPSFSVSHILSPSKSPKTPSGSHSTDEITTAVHSTPSQMERAGTPLFRSLLSVSPFSAMFSPGKSPLSSRAGMGKSRELFRRRATSPVKRLKPSLSVGEIASANETPRRQSGHTLTGERAKAMNGGIQPPDQPHPFSPSRSDSPPRTPTLPSNVESKNSFRIHPSLRKDDTQWGESQLGGGSTLLGEESIGLGYSSRMLHSQKVLDLSRYYHAQLPNSGSASRHNHKQRRKRAQVAKIDTSPKMQPVFGSNKDPDSDSLDSSSSIATYNSSKLNDSSNLSPYLGYKEFKPSRTVSATRPLESGEDLETLEGGVSPAFEAGNEPSLEGTLEALDLKDDIFGGDVLPADQKVVDCNTRVPDIQDGHIGFANGEDERNESRRAHNEDLLQQSSGLDTGDIFGRSKFGSPAHSMVSSNTYSTEGDSTFLVDSLRSVFSSATALGSSFLMKDRETKSELEFEPSSGGVNVGGIDLEALRECYEMMIELKPRTIFAIQVTNSIELLLARLELEQEVTKDGKIWSEEEMRAVIILLMNPFLFEQPYQESLLRRILLIFTALTDKATLTQWLSCMDEEGMAQLVTLFKMYLSAHFTPRPVGTMHPAICAVKALGILYEANNIGTCREQERQRRSAIKDARDGKQNVLPETTSTISFKYFYSGVMEALKFKDEYQIWREGWGKRESERSFSYFDYPFLLSPTSKSHILNLDALTQMSAHYEDACVRHALADHAQRLLPDTMTASAREFQKGIRAGSSPYLVLELTRAHLVEEAFEQITKKHADLKKPLKVAFVDVGEEGMDQGGVTKEFFQIMVEKVFDSQFGLFKELEEGRCWWFEGVLDGSSQLEMSKKDMRIRLVEYELVGILVGLALYNGVILGVRFPTVVYRKMLGWETGLDSFIESFPSLGHGLEQMLTWTDGDVYDVFMREFEISYEHLGQVTTLPLVPGGENIPVTNENRGAYVRAYMEHYVHEHIRQEFEAFQRGFEKICGGQALKLLRPEELELLLCGNSELDMHDLEASCLYDDGYSPSHTLIQEFWEIVHEDLSPEQHKQLLVFVTGSDRVPIRGLKDLMFVIQRNGPDSDRLPTALTCFSRLLLPEYANKEKMKERLVTAIENSNGFGLV